ncbi:carbohydrate ABC transporter permease [Saccharomonospora azurea]|uniref:Permease component of ABC-type sugar transporter n=1 Tax=Saccharomonospora azurea NA-128 TaxID=882081 RepID=H8G588_9PSEU|nr:sugar ABC transporter permease [Saccharomonospora azurea]EHK88223.1 permease component of ABC-type sugar transporter [Saccharomonospora azurea SZMC 14600]EHY87142.1 permease component of ABC-type sugar transporter [Saccharomonospora azurea NA-128]
MPRTATDTARRRGGSGRDLLKALPWIGPSLLLIAGVVLYPAVLMIINSTREISQTGKDRGSAGLDNYEALFDLPALPGVLLRTVLWVSVVVVVTIVLSMALANLLNKAFPGRQFVRLAVIVPWAASVVMTTTVIYYGLEPGYGIVQQFLHDIGLLDSPDFGFTKSMPSAFLVAIGIAIFVSLPFTTYTLLAGLQSVSPELLEAARIDGASPRVTYFRIVLPHLRPALAVATIINIINVYNNFPILSVVTGALPGYDADTTTTLMFKVLQDMRDSGMASALAVLNLVIVIAVIAVYVRIVKPLKAVDE